MAESVKVTILGSDFSLRTNDEALLRQLAAEIDADLLDLQQKLPTQPPTKLAILTALNAAEKHAHIQLNELREFERLSEEIDNVSDELEKNLS